MGRIIKDSRLGAAEVDQQLRALTVLVDDPASSDSSRPSGTPVSRNSTPSSTGTHVAYNTCMQKKKLFIHKTNIFSCKMVD